MKFEVRPLGLRSSIVNVGLAIGLILTVSACSGGEISNDTNEEKPTEVAGEVVELPAVWSTTELEKAVVDVAISGGISPILAVAYERSGLQFFDLDAEKVGKVAPNSVKKLATGYPVTVEGLELVVFPGINSSGELKGFVFGEGLVAPVETDLNINPVAPAAGICSAPAKTNADGLFRLGFWTSASDTFIHTGRIVDVNGEFAWLSDGPATEVPDPISACTLVDEGVTSTTGNIRDSAVLAREGYHSLVTLSATGAMSAISEESGFKRLLITDGISFKVPDNPVAIAALGRPLVGGYGGGLIVTAGDVDGESALVFIAADKLTGKSSSDE